MLIAAVMGAGVVSNLWTKVVLLRPAPKVLVWIVAIIGGAVASFFVVCTWITLKLLQFAAEMLGTDLGLSELPGPGTLLRRASSRLPPRAAAGDRSDWERILNARRIGGERVVHEGGFTYIGGRRVMTDGAFTYVGDERVTEEGGVLRIGERRVTREGGGLFLDGERVEE